MWKIIAGSAELRRFCKARLGAKAGDKDVFHTTYSQLLLELVLAVGRFGMKLWLVNIICI